MGILVRSEQRHLSDGPAVQRGVGQQ